MAELIYKEEAFRIVGICMKIHQTLGMGLKEINYKDAMEIEFIDETISYEREKKFTVKYKERILRNPYIADFVVFDSIIIEVKSTPAIIEPHMAQTLSYLAVSGLKLALVINFGERTLTWKRIVL
ncbi:MAG: GxxExxY protein [Bacteroidota bacterium]